MPHSMHRVLSFMHVVVSDVFLLCCLWLWGWSPLVDHIVLGWLPFGSCVGRPFRGRWLIVLHLSSLWFLSFELCIPQVNVHLSLCSSLGLFWGHVPFRFSVRPFSLTRFQPVFPTIFHNWANVVRTFGLLVQPFKLDIAHHFATPLVMVAHLLCHRPLI